MELELKLAEWAAKGAVQAVAGAVALGVTYMLWRRTRN